MNEKSLTENAKKLRRNLTVPEQKLWSKLRDRRLADLKFRRQQPLGSFIVDFICYEKRLVIEIDGQSHQGQYEYDMKRQEFIEREGFEVFRVSNDDVLQDMEAVLNAVLIKCEISLD